MHKTHKLVLENGEKISCYVAPSSLVRAPMLIVIPDVFGAGWIDKLADAIAAQGPSVVVPDLNWKLAPQNRSKSRQGETTAHSLLFYNFDQDKAMSELLQVIHHFRDVEKLASRVGAMGFSAGGTMALLLASKGEVECSACYYPTGIEDHVGLLPNLKKPVLFHFGGSDSNIPMSVVDEIKERSKQNELVKSHVYPDCDHFFSNRQSPTYNKDASELCGTRTVKHFREHLSNDSLPVK
jgi:carboxymethylenebutenolidase